MNARLKPIYEKTLAILREDARVAALYVTGSVGTPREDAHSDVDLTVLIHAAQYEAFHSELQDLFRRAGVEPMLMWPERINTATLRNYAVFFETEGELLQYDITLVSHHPGDCARIPEGRLVFDRTGLFKETKTGPTVSSAPDRLVWIIEMYWIYAYILKKYLRRGDAFRIIAAEQELFHAHLKVLHSLDDKLPPDWWPIIAAELSRGDPDGALISYFGRGHPAETARQAIAQLDAFARDARAACARRQLVYPAAFEQAVRASVAPVLAELGA